MEENEDYKLARDEEREDEASKRGKFISKLIIILGTMYLLWVICNNFFGECVKEPIFIFVLYLVMFYVMWLRKLFKLKQREKRENREDNESFYFFLKGFIVWSFLLLVLFKLLIQMGF